MNRTLQIGVTGGIGSGKSLICRIFRTLGAPVYDADLRARELMTTDRALIGSIVSAFGPQAYLRDGSLNRKFLAETTFGNPEALARLNGIVHPRVAQDYSNWAVQQSFPYIIREAALLYESGSYQGTDKMVVVISPYQLRIRRVLVRDPHRTEKEIEAIIKSQLTDEEKIKRADHLIYNDEQQLVIPQVLDLHNRFTGQLK